MPLPAPKTTTNAGGTIPPALRRLVRILGRRAAQDYYQAAGRYAQGENDNSKEVPDVVARLDCPAEESVTGKTP